MSFPVHQEYLIYQCRIYRRFDQCTISASDLEYYLLKTFFSWLDNVFIFINLTCFISDKNAYNIKQWESSDHDEDEL